MAQLTEQEIKEIKALREDGKKISELAKRFNVSRLTISWHTDENRREKVRNYRRKYRKNNRRYYESQKEYQRNYHRRRYKEDKNFRKKHLESIKKSRR